MVVGTVYNKWGRCVSIKYSRLWYNYTKHEQEKKNPVIVWSKTLIFKWLYNKIKFKKKLWGISCFHTYIQEDGWGNASRRLKKRKY